MAGHPHKHFERYYWVVCAIVLVVVILRCLLVPFAHDEVATFYFYIQPGKFLPFLSHPDANGHFLMSASSWIFFKLLGSSPVVLRMPCILAFILLCYGVFRMNKLFTSLLAKLIFSSAFILSFNFINFYSLCRGYGISIAFLMLGMYYFFVYIRYFSFSHLMKFLVLSQLALSANLTLVLVLAITTFILMLIQLQRKILFSFRNISVLVLHFVLLYFWVKYAFYLKVSGALYYGSGDSYWQVTFRSLIETITMDSLVINALMIMLFVVMAYHFVITLKKERILALAKNHFVVSFLIFVLLITAFYLLKLLFGVNFPEDRTGLFFYLFFMTSLGFMINSLNSSLQLVFIYIPLFFIAQFVLTCNLKVHAWRTFETIPHEFFNILLAEQKRTAKKITIAGHRVREFFYGFMNYNSNGQMNHMTAPEALQMNCDYAVAYKHEKPEYDQYYEELDLDPYWDFVLLRRRQPLERLLLSEVSSVSINGSAEYYNAFEKTDTTFNAIEPLQASFNLSVDSVPVPLNAWLVIQIDGDLADKNILVRTPLDLVKYNWNGTKEHTLDLVTGNIPFKIKRIVAYIWNIDKKPLHMTINSFRLYRLKGDGVTKISKATL